jgi:hypothetical protein
MDWILGASLAINGVLVGLGIYFREAVGAFIDFRKSKALEEFKKELDERYVRRYKAEKLGELLALLLGNRENSVAINEIIFEMALAMPRDLVVSMGKALTSGDDKQVMSFFVDVRKHLGVADGLKPEEVAYWVPKTAQPARKPAPW